MKLAQSIPVPAVLRLPALAAAWLALVMMIPGLNPAAQNAQHVELNVGSAGPREVEDTTRAAILRDYTSAWKAMTDALAQNRPDLLGANFSGAAQENLGRRIADQQKNGITTRIVDRGHKVEALFYSPEGSAMQLRDTASLELQVLAGEKVISSQQVTLNYLALMTAAQNRWQVRVLQAQPGS